LLSFDRAASRSNTPNDFNAMSGFIDSDIFVRNVYTTLISFRLSNSILVGLAEGLGLALAEGLGLALAEGLALAAGLGLALAAGLAVEFAVELAINKN